MPDASELARLATMARTMRQRILEISHACNLSAHLGGGLSMVEIMAVLYGGVLRVDPANPRWAQRDRFILSKGHGVLGYYAALRTAGFIDEATFASFQTNGSALIAHPVMNLDLGIESSNGSLGQGLSMAVGIALAARKRGAAYRSYVLLGDGECNEGSVWEAVMSAAQLRLGSLTAIVDYNRLQSDGAAENIIDLGDLGRKFGEFGWQVLDVDGHSLPELLAAFAAVGDGRPKAVIARTVKGKGISFMENNNEWHHNRLTKTPYEAALAELGETHAGN
ncbi:MAG: transketolase [Rhodoferax sp.]